MPGKQIKSNTNAFPVSQLRKNEIGPGSYNPNTNSILKKRQSPVFMSKNGGTKIDLDNPLTVIRSLVPLLGNN